MKKHTPTPINREERREFARRLAQALAKKIANDNYAAEVAAEESSS